MTRARWFVGLAVIVAFVNDGWSGRPGPLSHQLLLLPLESLFLFGLSSLLGRQDKLPRRKYPEQAWLWVVVLFEVISLISLVYAAKHFVQFGYRMRWTAFIIVVAVALLALVGYLWRRTGARLIVGAFVTYAAGAIFSLADFPLNYLRSDMVPVIVWADQRLLSHLNPYGTIYVGTRVYDFPYLPGVLVAYFPAIALHLDPRWLNLVCMGGVVALLYRTSSREWQVGAAALIAVFLLSPFLQYRHDLYLQPHWLALTTAIVLLQKRRPYWSAAMFGVSMAIYQLSWVLWPFLMLHALRRKGWMEVAKTAVLSLGAMGLVVGPFLAAALSRIASNTVGQWSKLPHALADPMNLSYWVTYLVRPDQLKWVQLGVLTILFGFCVIRGRCATVEDTLRWMSAGLALFIALNVLVDGYFYLTLLLLLLMYTLSATGMWSRNDGELVPAAQGG